MITAIKVPCTSLNRFSVISRKQALVPKHSIWWGSTEMAILIWTSAHKALYDSLATPAISKVASFSRELHSTTQIQILDSLCTTLLTPFASVYIFCNIPISDFQNYKISAIAKHKLVAQFAPCVAQHSFESLRSPTQSDFTPEPELSNQITIACPYSSRRSSLDFAQPISTPRTTTEVCQSSS